MRVIRDPPYLSLGAEQYWEVQPGGGGLHRASQRVGAAWVDHTGEHRLNAATALDKSLQAMFRNLMLLPRRRSENFEDRGRDDPTCRVGALTVQHDDAFRALLPHEESGNHRRTDRQRAP